MHIFIKRGFHVYCISVNTPSSNPYLNHFISTSKDARVYGYFQSYISNANRQDAGHMYPAPKNISPNIKPAPIYQASEEDPILVLLQLCTWSLARAVEIMDSGGLVFTADESAEPWQKDPLKQERFLFPMFWSVCSTSSSIILSETSSGLLLMIRTSGF